MLELDKYGMSPYTLILDLDANAGQNVYAAKGTATGIVVHGPLTPQEAANFLDDPSSWYRSNLTGFAPARSSYITLAPEQIQQMNLPEPAREGEYCPGCNARFPGDLVVLQNADVWFAITVDAMGDWSVKQGGTNLFDHIEYQCANCGAEVSPSRAIKDRLDAVEWELSNAE